MKINIINCDIENCDGVYITNDVKYRDKNTISYKKDDRHYLYRYNKIWRLGNPGVETYIVLEGCKDRDWDIKKIDFSESIINYNGQAQQDKFVINALKFKRNGYFIELGSCRPIINNNTFLLEKKFDWKGIMVEYDGKFLSQYKKYRKNSIHVINDATKIDYQTLFSENNVPLCIDYLQIDLDVGNGSTLKLLNIFDDTVFDKYKFATITFEHDIYQDIHYNTRKKSREIFKKRGYICVFEDIHNMNPKIVYEDWYVHPDLVDMEYINEIKNINLSKYVKNIITGKSIGWDKIEYIRS